MKLTTFLLSTWAVLVASAPLLASENPETFNRNWPQWRGPLAKGVAPLGEPPVKWSETENVKWKVKIPGFETSTPVIWENQVFILTAIPTGAAAAVPKEPAVVAQVAPDGP